MPFDGTSLSQVKRDLIAGKQLLIEKGWVPYCGLPEGPHCVMTANQFSIVTDEQQRRLASLNVLVRAAGLRTLMEIADWNDRQTSIEPVLALFDEAIASA